MQNYSDMITILSSLNEKILIINSSGKVFFQSFPLKWNKKIPSEISCLSELLSFSDYGRVRKSLDNVINKQFCDVVSLKLEIQPNTKLKTGIRICSFNWDDDLEIHEKKFIVTIIDLKEYNEEFRFPNSADFIVNKVEDAITWIGPDQKVKYLNRVARNILGLSEYDDCTIYGINEFHEKDEYERITKEIIPMVLSGKVFHGKIKFKSLQGKVVQLDSKVMAHFGSNGEVEAISGIFRDRNELDYKESRLQQSIKMEGLSQFTSGIVHDLNSKIGAIMLNIGNLYEVLYGKTEADKFLDELMSSCEGAANLLKKLGIFGKPEVLAKGPVDVVQTINRLEKNLKSLVKENINLFIDNKEKSAKVLVDEDVLAQGILNLLSNSNEAIENSGTISLKLEVKNYLKNENKVLVADQKYVVLTVQDTGKGIAPDSLSKVFEPFYTTKSVSGGVGLGLSMVYGMVSSVKGKVFINSTLNSGTTVEVLFPLYKSKEDFKSSKSYSGQKMLVIEDEVMFRSFICEYFRSLDWEVHSSGNGRDANIIWDREARSFDAVIIDHFLPDIEGLKLADKFKTQNPQTKVIIMSGYLESNELKNHNSHDLFIMKPFKVSNLEKEIVRLLECQKSA